MNVSSFLAGVVIGLEDPSVEVREDVGDLELCARVISGELGREVVVMVIYVDRSAVGECVIKIFTWKLTAWNWPGHFSRLYHVSLQYT